ncbi:MAG TPA: PAS domain S-box protein [Burkholderiales bacterium]
MVDPLIYKALVDQAKDYALFVLHPDGRIRTWNLGAERIKGYAADEIIGRHFSIFYTAEAVNSGWPAQELKLATAEGRFEDEGWRVRKDGSRFWANVVITALHDDAGKLIGFSKITRDLTERRMHEEALRQSEERFRLLIEGVTDYAVFMLDPEGIVTSWNVGAERIKGYGREEIIGKHFSMFYITEDLDSGKPSEQLATSRRTGRAEDEGWRVRKNGERFWARVILTALHDAEGRLRGFAKVTQDLSQRRHLQQLELATKNVNEFMAVLAHELRNPIAPIRSAVQVMGKLTPGDPTYEKMRQVIDRQSAQLARIADDMIDISRISRGMLDIERVPVDMNEAVRRAIETAGPLIEAGRHTLEADLPAAPLLVQGDVHRLTQLLTNLLNNAARYTPPGGRITVAAALEKSSVTVKVRDTGRGIEPQMLERIFGMFVQGRAPERRGGGGGLGIGLALARRLAELHGGILEARSDGENKGSEFTVRIPALAAHKSPDALAAIAAAPTSNPAPPTASRRILVVDDNVDAATSLILLLQSLGHQTSVAYDGSGALRLAAEFHPDIVLLDIGMPGMDGYEVARRLRQIEQPQPMRIVAVTGWGKQEDRMRSRAAGFDLHLVKPVDITDLAQALSQRNSATVH